MQCGSRSTNIAMDKSSSTTFLLSCSRRAAGGLMAELLRLPRQRPLAWLVILVVGLAGLAGMAVCKVVADFKRALAWLVGLVLAWGALGFIMRPASVVTASLQTGLLDPIPLIHRSVNFVLLSVVNGISASQRHYVGAWLIAAVFFGAVFLNLLAPRFYCRFICPLGSAVWRAGALDAVAHRQA